MTLVDLQYLIMALALGGSILNANANIYGFYVWGIADVIGVYMFFSIGLYGMTALYFAYTCICIFGVYEWKKKKIT